MPKLKKKTRQMQPSRMLVLGFSIIILAGATLLFLPISSKSGQFSSFIDCLFTATSATCVTGITVLDTFNYFNGFGQGVRAEQTPCKHAANNGYCLLYTSDAADEL